MEFNFVTFAIIAVLAYSFHTALLTIYSRKLDGLTITTYRGLSFLITMSPLLLLSTLSEIQEIINYVHILLPASFFAVIAFASLSDARQHMPLGLSSAIRHVIIIIVAFFFGYFFLNESSTIIEIMLVSAIIFSAVCLSLLKMDLSHLKGANLKRGLLLVVISGVAHTLSLFFFTILTREINPFVATYFWESGIGIIALLSILILGGRFNIPKIRLYQKKILSTSH